MKTILSLFINAVAIYITARLLSGVKIDGFISAVLVSIILAGANIILKPILLILTLPINILTLGLFTFVINGILIILVSQIVPGFHVANIWWAIAFSFVSSLIGSIFHAILK